MLTRVADIYGYTPTSSQHTNTTEGSDESSSSGAITVSPNFKSQTAPSGAYYTVNKSQSFIYYDDATTVPTRVEYESGDARYGFSIDEYSHESEPYELCIGPIDDIAEWCLTSRLNKTLENIFRCHDFAPSRERYYGNIDRYDLVRLFAS